MFADYCKIAESITWFGTLSIPNELLMAILLGVGIGIKHSVKHIFFLLMNYLVYHLKEMQCLFFCHTLRVLSVKATAT